MAQAELRAEHPWPVKFGAKDVPARVVAHLRRGLDDGSFEPLARSWRVFQGVQTGADTYTTRIDRRLSVDDRQRLSAAGVALGDPILELPRRLAERAPWHLHRDLLAKSPESRGILYGAIDDDVVYLVVLKDPWKSGPVVLDRAAVLAALPPERLRSVRTDPELALTATGEGTGNPHRAAPGVLAFRRGRAEVARVEGPAERLDLLEALVVKRAVADVGVIAVPASLAELDEAEREIAARTRSLLERGCELVERVERLVCALYGVPDDLADEIVAHAVARAASGLPGEGEQLD